LSGEAHDICVTNACIDIDKNPVLHNINLSFARGSITALIGENGAGKTTLIHSVLGDYCPSEGSIAFDGIETSTLRGVNLLKSFGIVPSNPQDLFICHSVAKECALADQDRNLIIGTTLNTFKELAPAVSLDTHPRDLSSGQQLSLALAIALASQPDVLLLDEPTRGLDGKTKALLIERLLQCKVLGACIILATHDMELVAQLADRVLVMKSGTISAEGTPQEILCSTTGFQTLTGEIFAPLPLLTVDDVRLAYQHA
jgi:energy-coupling factor transport system ATP-binding protein